MSENIVIAITNDYPTDKYNLLIPEKSMQELSDMYKIVVNEVQINNDATNGGDVYVQTKGYNGGDDKLALNKTALSKLMSAAGIQILSSKAIIPSTTLAAIEMAKAIGKVVDYDTRDTAHEVTILVPVASGQFRTVTATNEIIIADLKAEYMEQKKNLKVYVNKKSIPATDEEKLDAVEKQLTQFLSHKRGQCETKTLNRALREAMGIKPTYTKAELQKPFIVAHVVPNLANPELKKVMISQYADSMSNLFGPRSTMKNIEAPASEALLIEEPKENDEDKSTKIDAEIIVDIPVVDCEKCGVVIEGIDEQWTADAIIIYSKTKFQGKIYCPDCQKEALDAFRKAKGGN
ncbi:hypothetical protein KPL47_06755 [Clostridium estertheticum]|uniref:hypothetical protein n=1 Tax=Clostridium estertheticum TaxID=238834 RepID=UPI001C0CC5B5|nr:hypothetical protein [Clostridium estertheticum]MBU3176066.1 hypothetical protein [Clostridium estertheticum]